jgi:hypothetical protein
MTERSKPDATRSLRLARGLYSPSDAARDRVWAALAVSTAQTAASTAAPPAPLATPPEPPAPIAPAPTAPAARLAAPAARALGALKAGVLVGVGFALGYWFAETRGTDAAAVVTAHGQDGMERAGLLDGASGAAARAVVGEATLADARLAPLADAPLVDAPLAPLPDATPAGARARDPAAPDSPRQTARPRERAPQRARAPATRAQPVSSTPPSSAAELTLLARAERAIRAGDGALARSFIEELELRFPNTGWREEREAILVLAACALEEPGAEGAARLFLERHQESVYFDRIRSLCRTRANGPPLVGH